MENQVDMLRDAVICAIPCKIASAFLSRMAQSPVMTVSATSYGTLGTAVRPRLIGMMPKTHIIRRPIDRPNI